MWAGITTEIIRSDAGRLSWRRTTNGTLVAVDPFSSPRLAYESLFARDINLLLGIFFISACLVVVVNLLVDLSYSLLDPRIELA